MISFFRNKPQEDIAIDFSAIGVDFHSHLVPNVDDGSKSLSDTLEMLTHLQSLGYHTIYTSPHIMGDGYTNTKADLSDRFSLLLSEPTVQSLNIRLGLIAEYLLDEAFEKLLVQNDFLTFGENHILVETSMNYEFPFVRDYIFELIKKGYKPILAHPERYRYLHHEFSIDKYEEFIDWGVELQLNLFSLCGLFGQQVKKISEDLIQNNLYSYVCTDIHTPSQLNLFSEVQKSIFLKKIIDSGQIKNNQFT